MKYSFILAFAMGFTVLSVQAESTTCSFGDKQRKIEVVYPENGDKICEVQYTKDDDMQVLWSANADKDFCTEKAIGLVEKQQGWGWSCESDMYMDNMNKNMDVEETPAPIESDMMPETKEDASPEADKG